MRSVLITCLVLCSTAATAQAMKPGKDDTTHVVKRRSNVGKSGDGSIEITRHVDRGMTRTTVQRPGRFGRQETTWVNDASGRLVRKTVSGMRMVDGRPDHYFVGEGDPQGMSTEMLAKVNHSAQQPAVKIVIQPAAPNARQVRATERDPQRWGARDLKLSLGWEAGPYRRLAEQFGVDYAAAIHETDVAALADR